MAKEMLNLFNLVWTPLVIPLLLGTGLSLVLTLYLLRRPLQERSRINVLMLIVGAWWATAYALELMSVGLSTKLFWAKTQYIGVVLFPIVTLAMGLIYTEHNRWLTRWYFLLLTLIPLTIILMIFTTEDTNFFWSAITLNTQTVPQTLHVKYEAGFWFFMIYSSLFTWGGLGLMLFSFIKSPILHRRQIRILFFCFSVVVVAIVLNTLDVGIAAYIDLQPYAILAVCIAIGWSSYQLQIGDIVPVAYLTVIDNIPDAVVILNPENRILKLNIAAQNLLQKSNDYLIGKPLAECSPQFDDAINQKNSDELTITEILVTNNSKQNAYEIKRTPVFDGRGHLASHIVIIRDITERIQEEREREQRHRYIQALWSTV
ncbi:MAG: PAS domain-containing protein, partial [Anaerolineales bacterium]